jgi:hypothetical protein
MGKNMTLDDWLPQDFIQDLFDSLLSYTNSQLKDEIDIRVIFSLNDRLIYSEINGGVSGEISFNIVISERFINILNRYLFLFSRSVSSIGGIEIINYLPDVIPNQWFPEIESLELFLYSVPDETNLANERIELFLACQKTAWNWLLMHEIVHIILGHLKFINNNRHVFNDDPAFYRAMEFEADNTAASWLMRQVIINPQPWLAGTVTPPMAIEQPFAFSALVVSSLYLLQRFLPGTIARPIKHLPPEIRHTMAVLSLARQCTWLSDVAKYDAILYTMTETIRIIHAIVGWPRPTLPTIAVDLPFEEQLERATDTLNDYERFRAHWQSLAFESRPNLAMTGPEIVAYANSIKRDLDK